MSPSKVLFLICLSFILGTFVESALNVPREIFWPWGFFILVFIFIICIYLLIRNNNAGKWILLVIFCILFSGLGILRMQMEEFSAKNNKLNEYNEKKVSFIGFVSQEPEIRANSQNLRVRFKESTILITTQKLPEYKFLDKLKITGALQTPGFDFPIEAGLSAAASYKNYLMKDHVYFVMSFPKIEKVGREEYNVFSFIYSLIINLKEKFRENINKNFSPPGNQIMQGMILGDRAAISKNLKNKFSVTGTSHIIAVSGTHIVILGSILTSILLIIGAGRNVAFYVSIFFICFYIVLVGSPSSGVRSGIMAIIFLLSQKFGRQNAGVRVITLAGAIMLLQNPLLLFYDVGFQLSFLAVIGLIIFEPLVKNFFIFAAELFFHKKKIEPTIKGEGFLSIISTTISAQIFTLPIIVYNFGNISWVYPITNILIIPTVYFLMLFGFLSVVAGIFFESISWVLSLPCYFILKYFLWVVDMFSKPWMSKTIQNISWFWLLLYYCVVGAFFRYLKKNIF